MSLLSPDAVPASGRTLFDANSPAEFWQLCGACDEHHWRHAVQRASAVLACGGESSLPGDELAASLGEGQFGPNHWRLSRAKRLYYMARPFMPAALRPLVRRGFASRQYGRAGLSWPVEERYARYRFETLRGAMAGAGLSTVRYVRFWPHGKRWALVLTHDVEGPRGQAFARELAALEERYGFRSCFNFVPEDYADDAELRAELVRRGFEVGVHGLRHDGKLFWSKQGFYRQAARINEHLAGWQAVGFRSPLTMRHPEWMQALDVEYDASFFDTDPFEPIPGGTMSIWPFFMGHFVELPYTLAQDHTLLQTLGERSPRLWLEKVDFIRRYHGMALLNAHPDYLRNPAYMAVYEDFLGKMRGHEYCWHALPRDVARWWRGRAQASIRREEHGWGVANLPGASIGEVRVATAGEDSTGLLLA